ncbi:hypothetical protein [Bartonella grahamii]|nr:hypothetical protein [Bartonella grahamii]
MKVVDAFKVLARIDSLISIAKEKEGGVDANRRGNKKSLVKIACWCFVP